MQLTREEGKQKIVSELQSNKVHHCSCWNLPADNPDFHDPTESLHDSSSVRDLESRLESEEVSVSRTDYAQLGGLWP